MGKWHIEYWDKDKSKSSIEKWADKLTDEQLEAVTKELKVLEDAGNTLRLPQSKPLGQGLFELRERRYGYRIYYTFHGKQVIILLAAGDKASQTRDIKIARERLQSIGRK
jgi:putative addiction module killer protein